MLQKHMLSAILEALLRHHPMWHTCSYDLGLNLILSCLGLGFILELIYIFWWGRLSAARADPKLDLSRDYHYHYVCSWAAQLILRPF
jgi:hypothetical protein